MGYTHYITQKRSFTKAEWDEVCEDFRAMFVYFENVQDIRLANGMGDMGTGPEITADYISFNGAGDEDSHETFQITRKNSGGDSCKTARKPYDLAVTAALCYLSTITERYQITSDGFGYNFVQGLEAARQAWPSLANRLDIPMGVMESDRWCSPYPRVECKAYTFNFCVDGRAYITRVKDGASYAFYSHHEAAQWAASYTEKKIYISTSWGSGYEGGGGLFNSSGTYNEKRWKALARQQADALRYMVETMVLRDPARAAMKPPAYVRPGAFPLMAEDAPRAYSFADLLNMAEAA